MTVDIPNIRLVNLFYPVQQVNANPRHQPEEHHYTMSRVDINEVEPNASEDDFVRYVIRMDLDEEQSENPPYYYALEAMAVLEVEGERNHPAVRAVAFQLIFGAMRERLAELTGRGPFTTVLLGPQKVLFSEQP